MKDNSHKKTNAVYIKCTLPEFNINKISSRYPLLTTICRCSDNLERYLNNRDKQLFIIQCHFCLIL